MRIAFVSTSLARVGPVLVIADLINHLPKKYEIDLYYFDDLVEIKLPARVRLQKVNFFSRIDFSVYDVVHSHMMRADFFCSIRRASIKKLISTMHSNFKVDLRISHGKFIAHIFSFLWVLALRRFDHLAFLTKSQLKNFPELSSNAVVVHNGRSAPLTIENNKISPLFSNDGFISIGACAHIVKRKGFHQAIQMLALDCAKNINFTLVGDGPELNNLVSLANSFGVRDRFITPGHSEDVMSYIKSFDVYIMTSYSEGMPLALLEAASCQCPIVCSNIDVVKEVFDEDEVTFYETDNVNSLFDAVKKTIERKTHQTQKALAKYLEFYTPEAMAMRYQDVYTNQIQLEKE